jgi:type IV secretion system protein VirD4
VSNNPFDIKNAVGFSIDDIGKSAKTGVDVYRTMSSWSLKRRLQKEGYDPITIDAAVEAAKAGRDPTSILAQAQEAYALRDKQTHIRNNPPPIHGSARWSQRADLMRQNLLVPNNGKGLSLGHYGNEALTWNGESHLLTIAPTRTGKSTLQIVPNLLQYKGSAVVLDPKGELFALTSKWREENVGPVYVLNPFGLEPLNSFTDSFNPLDSVKDSLSATKLAEVIYPRSNNPQQQFFDHEAIGFLSAVIEYVACYRPKSDRNLSFIRTHLSSLNKRFYDLLKEMCQTHLPASIQNAAGNFWTKSNDTGKPRVMDSINQHMRIWDNEGLQKATAHSFFNFKDLKDKPATVYLMLPFEEIEAYSTFVRMVFATALNAMLENKTKPEIPVLFVLDEFLALDSDDRFVSALRTHASAGVRLWFFLQDLPTLEQKYPTTWKSFLQVETKTFFGTDDPYTAKLVSEYLGDQTVAYEVPNMSASTTSGTSASTSYSISENLHLTSRNLMTPDEVIHFMSGDGSGRNGIHFMRNIRPVQAQLTPWFRNPELKART